MSKDIGLSLIAGLASALVYLSVLSGGGLAVFLAYLMPLPIILVGLGIGFGRAALAGALALAIVAAMAWPAVPAFAAIVLAPAFLVTFLALRKGTDRKGGVSWTDPGLIVTVLAVAACALTISGVTLVAKGGGIEEEAAGYVSRFLDQSAPMVPAELRANAVALWSALFPAMAGSAWLIMAVVNGLFAQWVVTKAGHARRPSPRYRQMTLPYWSLAVLGLAVAAGVVAEGDIAYLARNATVVLLWPQVLSGLAYLHETLEGRPHAGVMLALFYVVFFVVFGWALIAVAGLGLVRHWTRLRRERTLRSQEDK